MVGRSAQSGILYQNTVAVEFLTKLLLQEGNLDCIQIEAPEPVGDIVLYINQYPSIYLQVKENAPMGLWTATKLNAVGFWQSAKRQLEHNPNAQVWFVTSSAINSALRELTERCRRTENEKTFKMLISSVAYLQEEFIRIRKSVELEDNSTIDMLKHIYFKDSFGSTEAITQRVQSKISGPKDEELFVVLKDAVEVGARIRQRFTRGFVYSVLRDHGIVAIKRVEKKLLTRGLDDLISSCSKFIKRQIENTLGEKYIPDLFVTRQARRIIEESTFKSQLEVAKLLYRLQWTIHEDSKNLASGYKEAYVALEKKLKETIDHLRSMGKVDWSSVRPEIEKMIADLHHPEGAKLVEELRKAINNVTVIVDKAGRGKTNLLCHLAIEWSRQNPVVLFVGGTLAITDRLSLLRRIGESFGFETNIDPAEEWFHGLDSILQKQEKHVIVIIDAINEEPNTELLKANLEALAELTHGHNLRLIVSCRDVYWVGYFHTKNDPLDKYTALITDLGNFTTEEFAEVWPKYCNYFHITVESLSNEAKIALHNPLLLRFFCEAYGSRFGPRISLGPTTHIRLKKLFDDYWLNKSESIRTKLGHRSISEIDRFLKSLALNMLNLMSRYIPLNRIPAVTGESDMQTQKSKYIAILDEDVIIEQSVFGHEQRVTFVYDEFVEYMMARAVLTELPHDNYSKSVKRLIGILMKGKKYPSVLGVVGYAAIILKEEMGLSVWEPLLEKYPEWHLSSTRSLAQLDEQSWDQSMFSALRKMTEAACREPYPKILCAELLDLLESITISHPHESIPIWNIWLRRGPMTSKPKASEILVMYANKGHEAARLQLENALETGNEYVAEIAALALGEIPDKCVARILARHISHYSPLVRVAIAYSLGLFRPSKNIRIALLELMQDSDWNVCYNAAVSILHHPSKNVASALNELGGRAPIDDSYEREKESRLVKKMAYLWRQLHTPSTRVNWGYLISDGDVDEILEVMKTLTEQLLTHQEHERVNLIRKLDYFVERCQDLYFHTS